MFSDSDTHNVFNFLLVFLEQSYEEVNLLLPKGTLPLVTLAPNNSKRLFSTSSRIGQKE